MLSKVKKVMLEAYKKGYSVNYNGEVKNLYGEKIKLSQNPSGYLKFTISYNRGRETVYVHQLQAYQKYGNKLFETGIVVRHKNDVKNNNSYNNILIGSTSDNSYDVPKEKRMKALKKATKLATQKIRKFTDEEVINILKDREDKLSYNKICSKYNISKSTISYFFNKSQYVKKLS